MGKKIPTRIGLALGLISFGGNLAWAVENQYYNVFMYNNIIGDTFIVSFMVAITAVMSTVTTIFMGAVSDVKGKRKPFILYSFIFWGITTALFPYAAFLKPVMLAVAMAIFIDCVMTFFGATIYDACYNAYIVDVTTKENRGTAVSINVSMTMLGTLIVYAGAGPIITLVGDYGFYLIVGAGTGIVGLIGALLMKDSDTLQPLDISIWDHIKSTFNIQTLKDNKDVFLVLTSIAIWSIGFNLFFSFILIYLEHFIQLDLLTSSLVMFVSLISSVLIGIPLGKLVDRYGRKKIGMICLVGVSLGLVLFGFARSTSALIITGITWVCFMTGWQIAFSTWIKDLFPKNKLAQFNGFFLIANVLIGMVVGSPIGGLIGKVFGEEKMVEGRLITVPSPAIFFVGAAIVILAIIPLIKAKEKPEKSPSLDQV